MDARTYVNGTHFLALTAFRGLQERPDPLALEVVPGSTGATDFPEAPIFRVRLVNVDAGETRIAVVEAGDHHGG
ncbi:MAG: hypothetical protein JNL28_16055 [Planctomycetes bacterium]|nr:hypothetical protein [Planctomycetota bacterium]